MTLQGSTLPISAFKEGESTLVLAFKTKNTNTKGYSIIICQFIKYSKETRIVAQQEFESPIVQAVWSNQMLVLGDKMSLVKSLYLV